MRKLKKNISIIMMAIMMLSLCMVHTVTVKAETSIPMVSMVGLSNNPAVSGVPQQFLLTSGNYTGNVQYQVFYITSSDPNRTSPTAWTKIQDWTAPQNPQIPYVYSVPALQSGSYSFAIRVKRAGITPSVDPTMKANAAGEYDDAYAFNYTFMAANAGMNDVTGIKTDKTSVNVNDVVTITGLTSGTKYNLYTFNESATPKWAFASNSSSGTLSWTPSLAGNFILDVQVMDPSGTKVVGWKLLNVTVGATPTTAGISSITPTNVNAFKVVFSQPVTNPQAAVFALTQNGTTIALGTPTWNAANTEAVLTRTTGNFTAGTYNVSVTGITNLSATAGTGTLTYAGTQTVTSISITSPSLVKSAAGDYGTFTYMVKDQYGNDITKSTSIQASNSVTSTAISLDPSTGTGKIYYNFTTYTGSVVVTLVDPNTGVNTTATLNVVNAANISSVTFGTVALPAGTTRLTSGTGTVGNIPITVKDQSGNIITNLDILRSALTPISSNTSVATFSIGSDANGNPVININSTGAANYGTVLLTLLATATGNVYTNTITINASAAPATITFGDVGSVANGDTVYVPITVTDQFGNQLTPSQIADPANAAIIARMVSVANTYPAAVPTIISDQTDVHYGQLSFVASVASAPSTIVLTGTPNITSVSTVTPTVSTKLISVGAARVITSVTAPATVNLFNGASTNVTFNFLDQYGATLSAPINPSTDIKKFSVTTSKISGSDNSVVVTGITTNTAISLPTGTPPGSVDPTNIRVTADPTLIGSYTLTLNLLDATGTITKSSASVTVNSVANNISGLTYSIDTIPVLHYNETASSIYARKINVTAKDAAGGTYVVNPQNIIMRQGGPNVGDVTAANFANSSDPSVADVRIVNTGSTDPAGPWELRVYGTDVAAATTDADKTATITVNISTLSGNKTLTTPVTVSPKPPVISKIMILNGITTGVPVQDTVTLSTGISEVGLFQGTVAQFAGVGVNFSVLGKDQYGIWDTVSGGNAYINVNSTDKEDIKAFNYVAGKLVYSATARRTAANGILATVVVGGVAKQFTINVLP